MTKDGADGLTFFCDHSAVQASDDYITLTAVDAEFSQHSAYNSDTVCKITCDESITIGKGEIWKIQGRICKDDWSAIISSNDYSAEKGIVIYCDGEIIYGKEP